MKKLLLIRHARAEHHNKYKDFERPLKPSGIQDAAVMAQRLHAHGIIPQIIITSTALRTHETANIFTEHLALAAAHTDEKIYEASEETLLGVINGLPNAYDFVALVGHNPGISQIVYHLTGKIKEVNTCAVTLVAFETDGWQTISMNTGDLIYYDEP